MWAAVRVPGNFSALQLLKSNQYFKSLLINRTQNTNSYIRKYTNVISKF